MGEPIIQVHSISKQYHIGAQERANRTLRETLTDALASPVRNFRNLRRLTKVEDGSPDTIWALRDVSFAVQPGEVVGIIGRNGAGKSTLLKILSRITRPTSGEVLLNGRVASLLEVGTGFHPELTGRENIYLNGAILGMRKREIARRFDEIVAFSEIEKFLDTPVKRYSSGMYVRLAFAVAAHLEPEILLVDEVLAVGDGAFQKKCLGKMGEVARQGRTVLFVSHNIPAVESLCSRAVLLKDGGVAADGDVGPTIERYGQELSGNAVPRFTKPLGPGKGKRVSLLGCELVPDGSSSRAIRCSDGLKILLAYASQEEILAPAFVLSIIDFRGDPIYWLDSRYTHTLPEALPGSGTISCTTGPLNLIPGLYHVNAAILVGNEVVDQIESVVSFSIEGEDFYGVGRLPHRQHGVCLIPQEWSVDGWEK